MKKNNLRQSFPRFLPLIFGVGISGLLLTSCSSELGITKRPDVTVNYLSQPSPETLNLLLSQYRSAVRNNDDNPIPGLHADYAILLIKAGKNEEAKKQFNEEIKLFPESQKYVEFLKNTLQK